MPQIEVTFDIDSNGIVHVSAKDLGTGKEQHISITASSNMSKDDIDKAVKEAEQFAAEDKKKREAVDLRNNADQMVYQTEKLLSENGDKFSDDDKSALNTKLDALKEALKGDNTDAIKSAEEDLTNKFYEVYQKIYEATRARRVPSPAQHPVQMQHRAAMTPVTPTQTTPRWTITNPLSGTAAGGNTPVLPPPIPLSILKSKRRRLLCLKKNEITTRCWA